MQTLIQLMPENEVMFLDISSQILDQQLFELFVNSHPNISGLAIAPLNLNEKSIWFAKNLATYYSPFKFINILDFYPDSFGKHTAQIMAEILRLSPKLEVVIFEFGSDQIYINTEAIKIILDAIAKLTNLQTLTCTFFGVPTSLYIENLTNCLRENNSIREFSLTSFTLTNPDLKKISAALKNKEFLSSLSFNICPIDNSGLQLISELTKKNNIINFSALNSNYTTIGLSYIINNLIYNEVFKLALDCDLNSLYYITTVLRYNNIIEELILNFQEPYADFNSLLYLANFIQQNNSLKIFCLEGEVTRLSDKYLDLFIDLANQKNNLFILDIDTLRFKEKMVLNLANNFHLIDKYPLAKKCSLILKIICFYNKNKDLPLSDLLRENLINLIKNDKFQNLYNNMKKYLINTPAFLLKKTLGTKYADSKIYDANLNKYIGSFVATENSYINSSNCFFALFENSRGEVNKQSRVCSLPSCNIS